MKRLSFLRIGLLAALWGLLGVSVHVSAQSNAVLLSASDTVCTGSSICLNWTDSCSGSPNSDPTLNVGGGYWNQTYWNTTGFGLGRFKLTHNSGESEYSYWGGFTSGSNGDNKNYGYSDTTAHAGSVNWVSNQWGVMAGGGVNSAVPYLIAYWDYYSDSSGAHSLQISLNGDSLFTPNEVYVCNHPWPYYGNLYGDGFAKPLTELGDTAHVDLIIHAIHADGGESSITWNLAFVEDDSVYQSADWQRVSLSSLGTNVKALYFTMYSSDSDPQWGPNTAVYFCLDQLKVTKTGAVAPASAVARKATASAPKPVEVTDYFPLSSYTGGDVSVYNAAGKEVLKTTVKAGEKPNLSKLPAGEYRLRHGHKHIPIRKVK